MADYYSILKKTIASLPENNGAARRSVYSRARNAIVNQLKAYEPPLAPSEITAEQLRLEEAIRKVEAEAARESLGLSPTGAAGGGQVPKAQVAAPEPVAETPVPTPEEPPRVEPEAPAPQAEDTPSPLKDTLVEAEGLGVATSQAVQQAKEAVDPAAAEQAASEVAAERKEPAFDAPAPQTAATEPVAAEQTGEPELAADAGLYADEPAQAAKEEPAKKAKRSRKDRPKASDALRGDGSGKRWLPIAIAAVLALAVVGAGAYFLLPIGEQGSEDRVASQTESNSSAAVVQPSTDTQVQTSEVPADDSDSSKISDRLLDGGEGVSDGDVVAPDARTVTTTTITPQADEPAPAPSQPSIVTSIESEPAPTPPAGDTAPVPGIDAAPPAPADDNLVAVAPEAPSNSETRASQDDGIQRSILYEEGEDTGGSGTAAQGAVVWNIEEETNLDGRSQAVLSAEIEIPERDVKVDIRIKPNDDTSLPASHLVEIKYEFPENFAAGDVVNVPGLVMKPTEEARGDALIGASVKVSPGFFWIALSSLPNEQQRNMALLRERGWIDIPMLYENGKRGILTLEKGAAGEDAVEKAISSWQAG
ncbi:hypothetical protein [uncultured Roseibium sp.]|uniref:hypothetical protein n=1 Tax=uncultured Roseibium sp. TaxID=1936171 RepID=UPI002618D10E|nr:hypothetical protein [uncultured Roseibium sp.]